jgi:ribosomal protein L11
MGKMKINARKVQEEIKKIGIPWKGIRIIIVITVVGKDFKLSIENTASSLLIKELGPEYYNRERKKPTIKKHTGNLTLD